MTKLLERNCPIFQKVAQTDSEPINAKISTKKLLLKAQNIKSLLKPYNTYNKLCFETANLDEINLLKQKVTLNVSIKEQGPVLLNSYGNIYIHTLANIRRGLMQGILKGEVSMYS